MRGVWASVLGIVLMGWAVSAEAAGDDALARLLVRKGILTQQDLQELQEELTKEQQAQEAKIQQIAQRTSGVPEWVSRTTWKGDIRLRNEFRKADPGDDDNRQRIRFRYGFKTKVNDDLEVGARLATGSSAATASPTSTNQSFSANFNSVAFNLDRAYLKYTPQLDGGDAVLIAGIIANPFWLVSPLIFDSDVNLHGLAAQTSTELGSAHAFLNSGAFSMVTDVGESASLWSAQSGLSIKPFEDSDEELMANLKVKGALAYHDFKNVTSTAESETTTPLVSNFTTNTSALKDLNLINPTLQLSSTFAEVPVELWTDWVHNTSAGADDGWQIGFKVGKAKKPWNLKEGLEAGYFFQRLESNAVWDEITDGDFHGGGTNSRGSVYSVKLAVLKNSTIGVKWFDTKEITGTASERDSVQLDWVTKF